MSTRRMLDNIWANLHSNQKRRTIPSNIIEGVEIGGNSWYGLISRVKTSFGGEIKGEQTVARIALSCRESVSRHRRSTNKRILYQCNTQNGESNTKHNQIKRYPCNVTRGRIEFKRLFSFSCCFTLYWWCRSFFVYCICAPDMIGICSACIVLLVFVLNNCDGVGFTGVPSLELLPYRRHSDRERVPLRLVEVNDEPW